jgi:hypothetical protein
MSGSRRGAIVGGIWLIALGGVFLVQQALELPWSEAWPLFIVMAGVGNDIAARRIEIAIQGGVGSVRVA